MKTSSTFEAVLAEKYNIREEFEASGMFVAFPSSSSEPSGLVEIGLSSRCLVVARVNLSGAAVDYDLLSLTPVPLVSISVQDYAQRKVSVDSPFKASYWVYQQCTSEDKDEVWEEFLYAIKRIHANSYYVPCLGTGGSGDGQPGAAVIVPSGSITIQGQSFGDQQSGAAILSPAYSTGRCASQPDIFPSSTTYQNQVIPGRHSIDVLYRDVKFDTFVNDNNNNTTDISDAPNSVTRCSNTSMLEKFSTSLKRFFRLK